MTGKSGSRNKYAINHEQRDIIFFQQRAAERAANEAKSARLRELRLAKEADDRAKAELAAAQQPAAPKRKPRAK